MEGQLTTEYIDQLENWINTGPKTFQLLYSITRDGCDAGVFHQKCDRRGPTVTVLYNQQCSVYGGFTNVSWNSDTNGTHHKDQSAFLFQLKYSGQPRENVFPVKQRHNAVFPGKPLGPLFGASDLYTFHNSVANSGGYFTLNGRMSFGKNYDAKGVKVQDINNGNMNVTELEVYVVKDGKRPQAHQPTDHIWRIVPELNSKYVTKLKEEIASLKPGTSDGLSQYRILMLGPKGSGKSSFYNTVNSAFRDRITETAMTGTSNHSVTLAYKPYPVNGQDGSTMQFRLCDTPGLDETQGIDHVECTLLLDGHVPDMHKFNPSTNMFLSDPALVMKPGPDSKIHCVIIVLDSSTKYSDRLVDKIRSFQQKMTQREIPQVVVLTKIDKISKLVQDDPKDAFACTEIEGKVDEISKTLGVSENKIFPVKNYAKESDVCDVISAHALLAIRKALNCCEDYLVNMQMHAGSSGGDGQKQVLGSDTA